MFSVSMMCLTLVVAYYDKAVNIYVLFSVSLLCLFFLLLLLASCSHLCHTNPLHVFHQIHELCMWSSSFFFLPPAWQLHI